MRVGVVLLGRIGMRLDCNWMTIGIILNLSNYSFVNIFLL